MKYLLCLCVKLHIRLSGGEILEEHQWENAAIVEE